MTNRLLLGVCAVLGCHASLVSLSAAETSEAAKSLRLAVVQMAFHPTLDENRDRIIRGVRDAAAQRARVAVFPEGALRGAGSETSDPVEAAVADICAAAREANVYVVSGAKTFLPSVKKQANWMFVIGPDGREVLRYEKLYDNHRAKMPGVFLIDGVPCSTAICADRWLRGVVELPIQQGSQIFFELSNNYACEWVQPYGWYWNAPLARRNNVWSVLCNSGNHARGQAAPGDHLKHGHSAIIAPDGSFVTGTSEDDEQLLVVEIDPSVATRSMAVARGRHPALREFWEAGLALHASGRSASTSFQPLTSPSVELTLAAAPLGGDAVRRSGDAVPLSDYAVQIERAIAEASRRHADLVAFPARSIAVDALPRVQTAAKEHRIYVAIGALRHTPEGDLNSAYVVGPEGDVLTCYDQLSAAEPLARGRDPRAMWFRLKGVPAVVTVEEDALWTELSELPAVAGAQVHVHLDRAVDESVKGRQERLQSWVTCASFLTFSATVCERDAALWDDLHSREESRAEVKGTPRPEAGQVEVMSPFSANLIQRAAAGELIVATRRVSKTNPHHPYRTANMNPLMKPWYELGASLLMPQ